MFFLSVFFKGIRERKILALTESLVLFFCEKMGRMNSDNVDPMIGLKTKKAVNKKNRLKTNLLLNQMLHTFEPCMMRGSGRLQKFLLLR